MSIADFHVRHYSDHGLFRDIALPFLLQDEVANNLVIGLLSQLHPAAVSPVGSAIVHVASGAVAGVVMETPGRPLIVSTVLPAASAFVRAFLSTRVAPGDGNNRSTEAASAILGPASLLKDPSPLSLGKRVAVSGSSRRRP